MKYLHNLLLAGLLFANTAVFGQRNFKDGYIVNAKGDTVRGAIDLQDWAINPEIIQFRGKDGSITGKTPADIKAFAVNGTNEYRTQRIAMTNDEVAVGRIKATYDSTRTPKTAFFKILEKGKNLTLYNFTDKLKSRFILSAGNDAPTELEFHIYLVGTRERGVYGYRGELTKQYYALNANTPSLLSKIEKAEYTEEDLVPVIRALNGDNTKTSVIKNASGKRARLFIGAGINSGKLAYSGFVDLAQNSTGHINTLPQFNIGVDLLQNQAVGRWVIRGELSVYGGEIRSVSITASFSMNMLTISLKPQVSYNFYIKDHIKIFAGAGFALNLATYSNQNYDLSTNNSYNVSNGQKEPNGEWLSIPVKAGAILGQRVEVFAGYSFANTIISSDAIKVSATFNTLQGGVNILLGSKK